jgi:hypothetical protein
MAQLGQAVVYHVANNDIAWPGCCVQCMAGLGSLLCTGWLIIAQLSQTVVYHVANNDIAQPLVVNPVTPQVVEWLSYEFKKCGQRFES